MLSYLKKLFVLSLSLLSVVILSSCENNSKTAPEGLGYPTDWLYDEETGVGVLELNDCVILENCDKVTSEYTLPTLFDDLAINWVGDGVVYGNDTLVELVIPDGYELIGQFSFANCENLKNVYIGKDVYEISERAFTQCPTLSEFRVSSENFHFYEKDGCVLKKEDNTLVATNGIIPVGTKIIGAGVFAQNTSIIKIVIPEGVEEIRGYAFDRSSVSKVTLPESLNKMGKYAFAQCTDLKDIYIPESVTEIGVAVFAGIDGLIINCATENKPEGWDDEWLGGCTNYQLNWGVK